MSDDYKDKNLWLMQGDCLERMKEIPDGSVDIVLTDPPYGTVSAIASSDSISHGMKGKTEWDVRIDTQAMFDECNRILRTNGALILFSQEPYTSHLITNVHGNLPFSYRMVWLKDHFANSLIAKKAPVNYTEDVCVFFKKYDTMAQHPLRLYAKTLFEWIGKDKQVLFEEMGHQGACHFMRVDSTQFVLCTKRTYSELCTIYRVDEQAWFKPYGELEDIDRKFRRTFNLPDGRKYKSNVLEYSKDYSGLHPTQKPVALMEDLIKTYTNEGETVLDFTAGSFTTGVACVNINRKFIGIEMDENYFDIGVNRVKECIKCLDLKIEPTINTDD